MGARLALAAIALVAAACGGGDGGSTATADRPEGACPPARPPAEAPRSFESAPPDCLEQGVDYGAVVTTSEGAFTIDLAEGDSPVSVNNFVFLARWGWYDGDDFHRVVPGFVIQAGDPFGQPQGTGGPGYTISDEPPASLDEYEPGTVAMARTPAPNSAGSQWFVCVDCSVLPSADYAIVGRVVEGMDTVERIDALGVGDGPPSKPITITSVEITER